MQESFVWFLKQQPDGKPTPEAELWFRGMNRLKRWEGIPMIHRTSVFDHIRRVAFLGQYLGTIVLNLDEDQLNPDFPKIGRLGYHHDDEESITGDLPTDQKRAMSSERQRLLEQQEEEARKAVGHFILTLPPSEHTLYQVDRQEVKEKRTLESQIVEAADKLDAYGEILHEIRCGNERFLDFLPLRQVIISELDRFPFWPKIKTNPNLDLATLPTAASIKGLPRISLDDFSDREEILGVLLGGTAVEWPYYYWTWAYNQVEHIPSKDIEKMILPGWCTQLWAKWGIPPGTKSTPSGIALPR